MSTIREAHHMSRAQRVKRTIIWALKRTLTFLLSHVGLTSVVVGYVMFGGILFMAIEKPYELKQRRVAQKHRNHAVEAMVELIMATYTTAQNTSGPTSGPNSQTGFTSVSSSVIDSVNSTTASLQEARGDVNGSEFGELENKDGSVSVSYTHLTLPTKVNV